jgi:sucrose phosphorylase
MPEPVHLITYPNRLSPDLPGLRELLDGPLHGVFGGIHVLPFFAFVDGADAGFDPTDHREVDPRVGNWDDVTRLGERAEVCCDLIANHVSVNSPWARDVLERGEASPQAPMLLTLGSVFPDGVREDELLAIYRPRPGLPFTRMNVGGRPRLMWTTFTPEQLDLDLREPCTWDYLLGVLERMATHGVATIRLDAVGYVSKTPGTSCFLTQETLGVVDRLTDQAHRLGLRTLAEIHAPQAQVALIAGHVDRVYDFALPPLVLHALHSGDVDPLLSWLDRRPDNTVTVLDTHDGIGVVDVGADPGDPGSTGLLSPDQIDALVEAIHRASSGVSRAATGAAASNLDVYQVNCTWYDAVGRDDSRFCLSRLIQLFAPGTPHVYYVGLLAGTGDLDLLARTGNGRDVNRHTYQPDELARALNRPVVRALLAMIRLRGQHPAFDGIPSHHRGCDPQELEMSWEHGQHRAQLATNPGQGTFRLTWSTPDGERTAGSVAELAQALTGLADDPQTVVASPT